MFGGAGDGIGIGAGVDESGRALGAPEGALGEGERLAAFAGLAGPANPEGVAAGG